MPRHLVSTLCACGLAAGAAAQQLLCVDPAPLVDPSGAFVHLGRGSSRLAHFAVAGGERPRLVYRKARADGEPGHELRVQEGGDPIHLGTRHDVAAVLPSTVLSGFRAPWIDDLALTDRWLLVAARDARTSVPALARAPSQIVLVELLPGARVGRVDVLASYWGERGTASVQLAALHFDRQPDPGAGGTYASWSVVTRGGPPGRDDDVYYCRIGADGPLQAPQRAFAFAGPLRDAAHHVTTEQGRGTTAPQILVTARAAAATGLDLGIFTPAAAGARTWRDEPGADAVLDRLGSLVFFAAPNGASVRIHAADDTAAPERRILWMHDAPDAGYDAEFVLSHQPGHSRATWPDGVRRCWYAMFECHRARMFADAGQGRTRRFHSSEVWLLEATGRPVPLRSITPYPAEFSTFAQALSQNLAVITVQPEPTNPEFRFGNFLDEHGDALAFTFLVGR